MQEAKGDSVILEHIRNLIKGDAVAISDYLEEDLVVFLEASSQNEALEHLIGKLDEANKLHDKAAFFQAILDREKIISTGIGIGVAIPHAKISGYKDFFVAIGIQRGEGIEWQSLDGLPVRLIFLIGGPDDQQTQYLNILSMITTAIKDEEKRNEMLKAKNAAEVIAIFEDL